MAFRGLRLASTNYPRLCSGNRRTSKNLKPPISPSQSAAARIRITEARLQLLEGVWEWLGIPHRALASMRWASVEPPLNGDLQQTARQLEESLGKMATRYPVLEATRQILLREGLHVKRTSQAVWCATLICISMFLVGCGLGNGGSCSVSGRITRAETGQSVEGVTITFSGGFGTAATGIDGRLSKVA